MKEMLYPEDVENQRRKLVPRYNRAGALKELSLYHGAEEEPYVHHIAYNANGQRTIIAYGNGIVTAQAYDIRFRLKRLYSRPYRTTDHLVYVAGQEDVVLQDSGYTYDHVSNIVSIREAFPNSGVKGAGRTNPPVRIRPYLPAGSGYRPRK